MWCLEHKRLGQQERAEDIWTPTRKVVFSGREYSDADLVICRDLV